MLHRSRRPKVLYLTNQSPYPPLSGGQRREYEVLRRLSSDYEIHMLLIGNSLPDRMELRNAVAAIGVESMKSVQAEPASEQLPPRMQEHFSEKACILVESMLRKHKFELIHVECFFHMQSLPDDCTPPIVLFEENIEYDLQRQYELLVGHSYQADWRTCQDYEQAAWRRATGVGVNSADDLPFISTVRADDSLTMMVPLGADHLVPPAGLQEVRPRPPTVVGFIGNFRWLPSRDAVWFLLDHTWPKVSAAVPDARLRIIGAGIDDKLRAAIEQATRASLSENAIHPAAELRELDVFCAPLRVGGGVKMKVYEALAAGCAIVSTPPGAQGLSGEVRDALLIVNSADECADAVISLLTGPSAQQSRRELALHAARRLPGWSEVADRQAQLWQLVLENGPK